MMTMVQQVLPPVWINGPCDNKYVGGGGRWSLAPRWSENSRERGGITTGEVASPAAIAAVAMVVGGLKMEITAG